MAALDHGFGTDVEKIPAEGPIVVGGETSDLSWTLS